jgi:hypothetical protein
VQCVRRTNGTAQLSEIVCEMHVAYLLQVLSSLNAEHTNFSVVWGSHFLN